MLGQSLLSLLALSSLSVAAPLVGVVPAPDLEALASGDLSAITNVVDGTLSSVKVPRSDILSEVESTAASVPVVAGTLSTVEGVTAPATNLVASELNANAKRFVPLGAIEGAVASVPGVTQLGSTVGTVDNAVGSLPVVGDVASAAAPVAAPVLGSVAATAASIDVKRDLVNAVGSITDPLLSEVNTLAGPIEGALETTVDETVGPVLNAVAGAGLGIKRDVVSAVEGLAAPVVGTVESVAAPVMGEVESLTAPVVAPALNTVAGASSGLGIKRDVVSGVEGLAASVVGGVESAAAPVAGEVESLTAPVVAPVLNTVSGTGVGINVNLKRAAGIASDVDAVVHAPVKVAAGVVGNTVDAVDNNLSSNKIKDNLNGKLSLHRCFSPSQSPIILSIHTLHQFLELQD